MLMSADPLFAWVEKVLHGEQKQAWLSIAVTTTVVVPAPVPVAAHTTITPLNMTQFMSALAHKNVTSNEQEQVNLNEDTVHRYQIAFAEVTADTPPVVTPGTLSPSFLAALKKQQTCGCTARIAG